MLMQTIQKRQFKPQSNGCNGNMQLLLKPQTSHILPHTRLPSPILHLSTSLKFMDVYGLQLLLYLLLVASFYLHKLIFVPFIIIS